MKSIVLFAAVLRIILITAIISFAIFANAQSVAVNTTGNAADASAMLDISSNSKGVLITRVTTTQRTGIATPAEGLLVYDTDTKGFWYFSLGAWKEIPKAAAGGFTLPYNASASNNTGLFSITNTNAVIGASGLYGKSGSNSSGVTPLYSSGVWGENSSGIGVSGTSKTVGVFGATGLNDASGIGVMAISSSTSATNGAVTAINQSKGIAVYAESLDSGMAVYGKTKKQNGAAIYGINNSIQGHGVRGAATGTDGVGIYGDGGAANSSSYAGFFRNSNPANTKDVVQIYNQGAGRGLMVDVVNSSNTDDVIEVRNNGTGRFLSLITGLGEVKTTIAKSGQINTDGNIYTEGTLSVRGNKGIVRSTYSNQMRMELMQITIPGNVFDDYGEFVETQYETYTFNTPYSSAPAVQLANVVVAGGAEYLGPDIINVTTTGFTIRVSGKNYTTSNTSFKVIVVGYE